MSLLVGCRYRQIDQVAGRWGVIRVSLKEKINTSYWLNILIGQCNRQYNYWLYLLITYLILFQFCFITNHPSFEPYPFNKTIIKSHKSISNIYQISQTPLKTFMKIIIRDILANYFPKYLPLYQSLPQSERQAIFSHNNKHDELKDNKEQLVAPEMGIRKSLSVGKEKGVGNGKRSVGREEVIRSKSVQGKDVVINNQLQKHFSQQQQQRLSSIITQRLHHQLRSFITSHRFHSPCTPPHHILHTLSLLLLSLTSPFPLPKRPPTSSKPPTPFSQPLYKLSLYLNKQTNKQIFSVYQYILAAGPKTGISYQTLAKKLKTDIINVSHYCCKLKKMRFVDWEHRKEGVVVYPKVSDSVKRGAKSQHNNNSKDHNHQQQQLTPITLTQQPKQFDYSPSFIFSQLSLTQNILINVSSSSSLLTGGLTNQQIKFKIMKHAQNKMVRRTVQGMKHIQRHAQRQGKVFEFKYKRETVRIMREMDRKRVEGSGVIGLTERCKLYLNENYQQMCPQQLTDQQLLQHIVNTRLTDYVSSIGIKQSKRQCTPLKLNRYIYILNYLQHSGPQTQLQLRRHIIEVEKQLQTYQGIIHKRSVIGILQGLKKIGLIGEEEGDFFAIWVEGGRKQSGRRREEQEDRLVEVRSGRKRVKVDGHKDNQRHKNQNNKPTIPLEKVRMITKRQHLNQIFTQLLNFTFQKALKRILRKGFHRIMYAHRKKQSVPMFISQPSIFHLLDERISTNIKQKPLTQHSTTLQSFMSQVEGFIATEGKSLQQFPQIDYQVVKYVRRNPNKNADNLRSKYGKGWREKFDLLEKQGVIKITQEGYETLESFDGYLV